ncbi:MAG: bifunctional phosphoribosylaminoimidazolecarboxamide formyltransferase/IMP cyclohydrolase [Bdellovibrio sp.]|nr:bifunctional phosphoribosylaminoimidazolecarboxamide formyltransferase/IMP cyclohydrolase [Bdellovibrio sp.]
MELVKAKTALLSVYDKTGLLELAQAFRKYGIKIYASGGTCQALRDAKIDVSEAQELTKTPEAFHGRMKTLSFPLMSGILFRREAEEDCQTVETLGITPVDIVAVNFYPFPQKAAGELPIDLIDIGGPCLLRAAAKNFASTVSLVSPADYTGFVAELDRHKGATTLEFRKSQAQKTFQATCEYDKRIFSAFAPCQTTSLRYGENPHQDAQICKDHSTMGIAHALQLQGKEMSYNNYLDADQAWMLMSELVLHVEEKQESTALVVKHGNPCGIATAPSLKEALAYAIEGDPISAFGGIVALSKSVNEETAHLLTEKFYEIILAPDFDTEALKILHAKKNLRLLKLALYSAEDFKRMGPKHLSLVGGELICQRDLGADHEFNIMGSKSWPAKFYDQRLFMFGTLAVKAIKSNAICLVGKKDKGALVLAGMGAGNPNRVLSLEEAARQAKHSSLGIPMGELVLFSDAFFPFKDSIELAGENGISWIVEPGGSIKDQEVIAAANSLSIGLIFTGRRHFNH